MDDNKYDGVKDVKWKQVNNGESKIKFISSRKKSNIKKIIKLISFILLAVISGGISGAYTANKKQSNTTYTPNNQTLMETKKDNKNVISNSNSQVENPVTKVAESVGPTVVGISNKADGYFGIQDTGTGSGIIIDSRGYIVTNYHVIENADRVTVKLSSGKILDASISGTDEKSDLAVIKVNAQNLPKAQLGDSSKIKIGDIAVAIGNPLGENFSGSVTAGIISALNRKIEYNGSVYKVIQTDAAINPGNSGGPLCNTNGQVIGINSFKFGSGQNTEGIGFAISINEVKSIIKQLMNGGKVAKPYLGIYGEGVTSGDNKLSGIYIQEVLKDSGAFKAGIKPTDILLELDGKKVIRLSDVSEIVNFHKIGDKIKCKILRNGNTIELEAVLYEMPEDK
ncbi:trypsin-like peptidase domain-containing protein [Clostridium tyrobutyricum]|uniref:S1C family serine protease n=1 Tax=Clostridium tyrobutyricum TaxID=1519 RepID=UPI000310D194|nr:trypsin-like peptidase domain-containing protein [Clostridium tyrobutyricum]MBR9648249.1 trypsin-like peptidase domain-containing protein [Clostridium tyrobutyricum]MBV4416694.1 trypsin-like peptidase domain-containing protein [Clostridium tyrobutyricum]MBV4422567.1 trypsin-like peptidase domain-containing protein [Clostridium tyrobutyricum]MBV4426225.1 trypsin-like peptidase domain-containing protein [Clostridium tyrobutyricum]MBV4429011.1 trypsin-like peptidase domain-containing protein [